MAIYVMTMILDVGNDMKWMVILNICLIFLKKLLEINFIDGYLKKNSGKNDIVEGKNIVYISYNW